MAERSSLISYPQPFWPIRPNSPPVHLQYLLCHWPAVYSKQHLQALFIAVLKLRMSCGQTSTHLTSFSPFKSLLRISSAIIPEKKKVGYWCVTATASCVDWCSLFVSSYFLVNNPYPLIGLFFLMFKCGFPELSILFSLSTALVCFCPAWDC